MNMIRFAKGLVIGAGTFIAASTMAQAQVFYVNEDTNLQRAEGAMRAGDLENASKYFKRAVNANLGVERLVPALNNYCAVDYAIGNLEEAEKSCTRALREDRQYWRAYVNRANVRASLGKNDQAHADYQKALRLKPDSIVAKAAFEKFVTGKDVLVASVQ
jgi:tetratricopeptide (TPR) repeat protein